MARRRGEVQVSMGKAQMIRPRRSPEFQKRKERGMKISGRDRRDVDEDVEEVMACVKTGNIIVMAKVMKMAYAGSGSLR